MKRSQNNFDLRLSKIYYKKITLDGSDALKINKTGRNMAELKPLPFLQIFFKKLKKFVDEAGN